MTSLVSCTPGFLGLVKTATPTETTTPTHLLPTTTPSPPTPTLTPTITVTPSPTPVPVFLSATVWTVDPQVPILAYHRFYPDSLLAVSNSTKIRLSDFQAQIQIMYDNGYSLVPLDAWLTGDMRVPAGRKPLIITIDDLFFADQIFLNPDGTPSSKSGIGLLWQFSQAHPEFGFAVALFYNMGDKQYGNVVAGDWWIVGDGWQDSLAKTIAWCIQHGAMPYNHFYTHAELDLITSAKDLNYQLQENEKQLRASLARIDQQNLADNLANLIAIPYGIWPTNQSVMNALLKFVSTNNQPLLGIMDIDFAIRAKYLLPVYAVDFNRQDIPRIVANQAGIEVLVKNKDNFSSAQECKLGPVDLTRTSDPAYIEQLITDAWNAQTCPAGVYSLEEGLYNLKDGQVTVIPVIIK
jgi:hypothetical protein